MLKETEKAVRRALRIEDGNAPLPTDVVAAVDRMELYLRNLAPKRSGFTYESLAVLLAMLPQKRKAESAKPKVEPAVETPAG